MAEIIFPRQVPTLTTELFQHETGPIPLYEVLRLLVLLTYDSNVVLQSSWVDGLTQFVLKEMLVVFYFNRFFKCALDRMFQHEIWLCVIK